MPAIILSLIIASLYAGLFHFVFAQKASDILRYWLAAIIGFLLGAAIGLLVPWSLLVIGDIHLLEGTLACTPALFLARWLLGAQAEQKVVRYGRRRV